MWTNARDPLGRIHTTQWKLQHEKRSMLHYKIYTSTPKIPRDIPSASCTVSQKPVEQTRLSIIVGGVTTTKPNRSNPKNTINMSPSNKARRLLELQVQHVQELQHDVLEAHPKQAARRFPVYHAVRFIDIQSGSNIIKLLILMWTRWNMLEPLHEPSWYLKTTHHVSLVATDSQASISQSYTLQKHFSRNITTKCDYQRELSSKQICFILPGPFDQNDSASHQRNTSQNMFSEWPTMASFCKCCR